MVNKLKTRISFSFRLFSFAFFLLLNSFVLNAVERITERREANNKMQRLEYLQNCSHVRDMQKIHLMCLSVFVILGRIFVVVFHRTFNSPRLHECLLPFRQIVWIVPFSPSPSLFLTLNWITIQWMFLCRAKESVLSLSSYRVEYWILLYIFFFGWNRVWNCASKSTLDHIHTSKIHIICQKISNALRDKILK